jgi:hypothetical protein
LLLRLYRGLHGLVNASKYLPFKWSKGNCLAESKVFEAPYQNQQLEGYDNGRRQFVTTCINNYIGSDIELQTGTYEATTHSFVYEWESELVPGQKQRHRRVLRVPDAMQYAEDYMT